MASIARTDLFCWADIDELGDLERLEVLFRHLPDEPLMQKLEAKRGNGRDDYPVRAIWNSLWRLTVRRYPPMPGVEWIRLKAVIRMRIGGKR